MRALHLQGRALAIGVLALLGSSACISAPGYTLPTDQDKTLLVPGFDSSTTQIARWSCPAVVTTTKEGGVVSSPGYEIVLIEDPARGMLLHELNNDWVMLKPTTIAGGGTVFSTAIPYTFNEFIVPPDRTQDVTHKYVEVYVGGSFVETDKLTRMCKRGAPVRIL